MRLGAHLFAALGRAAGWLDASLFYILSWYLFAIAV